MNVDYTYDDIRITGVIGKPVIARSNRSNQLFFVNKRFIKDKALTSSAEQGFKGMLTIGKYGFLILNLEIDPHKVDVNVHPAKLEVRFEEESKVFKAVYHAIKETLLNSDLVKETEKTSEEKTNEEPKQNFTLQVQEKSSIEKLESINPTFGALFKKIVNNNLAESQNNIQKDNVIEELYHNKLDNQKEKQENNNFFAKKEVLDSINLQESKKEEIVQNVNNEEIKKVEDDIKQENIKQENVQENNNTNVESIEIGQEHKNLDNKIIDKNEQEINKEDMKEIIEKLNNLEENKIEIDDKNFEEMYAKMFGKLPNVDSQVNETDEEYKIKDSEVSIPSENISLFSNSGYNSIPDYKFIGIAFSTYIIIEMDKEIYIIDQHAAHERIMYEKIKKNYYSDGPKESQLMLLPDIITLTHKEMGIAKDNIKLFEKAGFTLEEFGENTIKISGVPNICIDLETKELFLETLDEINTVARTAKQEIEEKFIATLACKSAVKANMALTKEEVDNLMKELLLLPNPFTCPHGRPTAIKMSKIDIEKKFSRR